MFDGLNWEAVGVVVAVIFASIGCAYTLFKDWPELKPRFEDIDAEDIRDRLVGFGTFAVAFTGALFCLPIILILLYLVFGVLILGTPLDVAKNILTLSISGSIISLPIIVLIFARYENNSIVEVLLGGILGMLIPLTLTFIPQQTWIMTNLITPFQELELGSLLPFHLLLYEQLALVGFVYGLLTALLAIWSKISGNRIVENRKRLKFFRKFHGLD